MAGKKHKPERPKEHTNSGRKKLPEPDTGPDEFIAPNADTDLPIEGQVKNDSVLRGEDHEDDKIKVNKWSSQDS